MIVLSCGLSKSGKTTLIRKALDAKFGIRHIKASDLIKNKNRPIAHLRNNDVQSNQEILVEALNSLIAVDPSPLILDGHLLIETDDGPQLVSDRALRPLPIVGVVYIRGVAETIAERRSRSPLTTSISEIRDLIKIEALAARRFARARQVPLQTVAPDDMAGLYDAVQRMLTTKAPV